MIYPGNASGINKAQAKNFLPGNTHTLVNQAQPTPIISVPTPTPSISKAELSRYSLSTVVRRCCQTSLDGYSRKLAIVKMGRLSNAATRKIPDFHRGKRCGKLAERKLSLLYPDWTNPRETRVWQKNNVVCAICSALHLTGLYLTSKYLTSRSMT